MYVCSIHPRLLLLITAIGQFPFMETLEKPLILAKIDSISHNAHLESGSLIRDDITVNDKAVQFFTLLVAHFICFSSMSMKGLA